MNKLNFVPDLIQLIENTGCAALDINSVLFQVSLILGLIMIKFRDMT